MVIKHKILYILPDIECKYSLKLIFRGGGNVTFLTILQQILIESHIIGVQIPHPLALYRIASSKMCHKIELV